MSLSSSRPTSSSHLKNDSTSSPSSTSSSSSSSSSSLPAGSEGAYCFLVEWFDQQASMVRKYHLFYFLLDDTIEMYDIKNRRTFLKRCSYPSIQLADIYIGATLTVYARQLKCVGYGDEYTRSQLDVVKGRTIALIKSDGISQIGRIIDTIYRNQFTIAKMKQVIFNVQQACHFYGDKQVTTRASELSRGPVLAMEIIGKGVQQQLKQIADSKTSAATPFRDIHLSSSDRSADMESSYLFDNSNLQTTATLASCTVAMIKPHAVVAGQAGKIIEAIQEQGYEISCLGLYHLDRAAAQEFLEVYHTIIPEYNAIVEHFTSGPSIAMEIRQGKAQLDKLDIVSAFREFVGPADPEIARHIRPNTLRAQFGLSKVKNALHCTDLPEDGVLESEFFFSILQKSK